ncbi:MAG: tetratricopeptide repeat protein [Bacteroidota bacterium]
MKYIKLVWLALTISVAQAQQQDPETILALKKQIPTSTDSARVHVYSDLCYNYLSISNDSSLAYGHKAIALAKSIKYAKGEARALTDIGYAYYFKSDYDSTILNWSNALAKWRELNDSSNIGSLYIKLGAVYFQLGEFDESLAYQLDALRIAEGRGDTAAIGSALNNIASVHENTGEYDKATEYYRLSIAWRELTKNYHSMAASQLNIANILFRKGLTSQAVEEVQQVIEMLNVHDLGQTQNMAIALNNLADYQREQGSYQQALITSEKALSIRRKIEDQQGIISSLTSIASINMQLGYYARAESAMLENYALAEQKGLTLEVVKALKNLSELYKQTKDFEKSLNFTELYYATQDSLDNVERVERIAALQTQFETEKKEQRILLQQAQLEESNAKLVTNRVLLFSAVLIILALALIAILNRNRIKKKQQLLLQQERLNAREAEIKAAISSQEKERARYARDLHDGFGQMISVLNMNIKKLDQPESQDGRHEIFEASEKVVNEMYDELKSICFDLMPQTLVNQGIESALFEFVERINGANKGLIELNLFGLDGRLKEVQEISLYRITQEWVNNIIKYSDAQKILIQITKDEDEITLLIEDDGTGFDREKLEHGSGHGWKNIQARTALMSGEVFIENQVGVKGNSLILNAPAEMSLKHEEPLTVSA